MSPLESMDSWLRSIGAAAPGRETSLDYSLKERGPYHITSILILACIGYLSSLWFYRFCLHPLSNVPGPKLAAITYLPEIYHDVIRGGKFFLAIDEMHKRYGPIVRINPDEVHLDDPDMLDTIFPGAGRRTNKPDVVGKRTGTPNSMVATMDHDMHRRRRNAVNAFFSTASIRRLEPIMKEHMERMLLKITEYGNASSPVQLHHLFKACTSDVITTYAFGDSFGFLDEPDLGRPYFEATDIFFGLTHLFGHATWLAVLVQSLPIWAIAAFVPSLRELWKKQSWWTDKVREIRNSPNPERIKSIIFEGIMNSTLPDEDKTDARLAAEAQLVVFAGEGTTAYTLTAAVYELLANPQELKKLQEELKAAIPDLESNGIPSFSQTDNLPYLNAIINEVVRLHPGVMNRQPRISPDLPVAYRDKKQGKEYILPPGTLVTMSPLTMHMKAEVFDDPYSFRPQRWIDNPKIARGFLGFSRGSRSCLGMNLARKEMGMVLAALFTKYDVYDGQDGPSMELFDTYRARDIDPNSDFVIPVPAPGSKGLQVKIRG